MDDVTVVAGNGASLAEITPGCVLRSDRIIRTNNFFFEEQYFLGTRVDMAFVGGDPRVAPFVFETLSRARAQYDLKSWSAQDGRVAKIGKRFLTVPYAPMRYADPQTQAHIAKLQTKYQAVPNTGIRALLMAQGLGARRIVLAGLDLYSGPARYAYEPGRHQRDLLGDDLATRSYDRRLHHPDLDREIIDWLAHRPDLTIWRSSQAAALSSLLDHAPLRAGAAPEVAPKPQILDWASWAGWYPIQMLKILRKLRRTQRRLLGKSH